MELINTNEIPVTINDTDKYIKLRKENDKLDISIILGFIFIYRYYNYENIKKIEKKLELNI